MKSTPADRADDHDDEVRAPPPIDLLPWHATACDRLSAADIYWTGFSILVEAFSPDLCETPDFYRAFAQRVRGIVDTPLDRLVAHRDRIARDYFDTPMRF